MNSYLTRVMRIRDSAVPGGLEECVEEGCVYNLQLPNRGCHQYFGRNMIPVP